MIIDSIRAISQSWIARERLSARTVTHATAPTSMTSVYMHDLADRIIAELDASGQTQREYIWLDDMPVAVADNVASGNPVIYFVHVDHLMRPARMTAQDTSWVWDVIYAPFGGVSYIWSNPATQDMRFPGQWFQLESGLAYNWHRHYDATLGRYVQPDPIGLRGGRSLYSYVGGNPLAYVDPEGLDATRWINRSGGRPISDGPTNGNWGGGCWSGGQYSCRGNPNGAAPPTDSADACYMRHDLCYDAGRPRLQCDRELVQDLRDLPRDPLRWAVPPPPGTEGDTLRFLRGAILMFDR